MLTRIRDPDVLRNTQTLPIDVQTSSAMQRAMDIYTAVQRSNEEVDRFKAPNSEGSMNLYARAFKLISRQDTSYAMACLCECFFDDIRKGAFKSIRKSYLTAHKGPSISSLETMLGFATSSEVEAYCASHSIPIKADDEGVVRMELNKSALFDGTRCFGR